MATLFAFRVYFATFLWAQASGASIRLTSSVPQIQVNVTHSLTLRCSVHDAPPSASSQLVGRRDVTSGDLQFLTSLVVVRTGGEHVAAVTEHTAAAARVDKGQLHVAGDLQQHGDLKGFLELFWEFPQAVAASEYTCEANGLNADGHSVVLTSSVEVSSSSPECQDLVPIVHDHELKLDIQNVSISDLRKIAEVQKAELAAAESTIQSNKNQIASQGSEINSLKNTLATMQNQINSLAASQKHIEKGTITCGGSGSYSGREGSYWYKEVSQSFSKTYDTAPIVYLSVNSLVSDYKVNTEYYVYVTRIDTNKFYMRCRTWEGDRIKSMNVDWISFSH